MATHVQNRVHVDVQHDKCQNCTKTLGKAVLWELLRELKVICSPVITAFVHNGTTDISRLVCRGYLHHREFTKGKYIQAGRLLF